MAAGLLNVLARLSARMTNGSTGVMSWARNELTRLIDPLAFIALFTEEEAIPLYKLFYFLCNLKYYKSVVTIAVLFPLQSN